MNNESLVEMSVIDQIKTGRRDLIRNILTNHLHETGELNCYLCHYGIALQHEDHVVDPDLWHFSRNADWEEDGCNHAEDRDYKDEDDQKEGKYYHEWAGRHGFTLVCIMCAHTTHSHVTGSAQTKDMMTAAMLIYEKVHEMAHEVAKEMKAQRDQMNRIESMIERIEKVGS